MQDAQPRRFLIARLSAIGDCILTIPMANALRAHFPGAFVAWLVEQPAAPLLEGHEAIDELIVVPRGWLKDIRAVWGLRRRLRDLSFDVAIDAQSLSKSAIPAWLSGAKTRIGFAAPMGRELAPWLNNRLVHRTARHVVDTMFELLQPLGIESPAVEFRLPVDQRAEASCEEFLAAKGLADGYVVLNPGAGWASRLWPRERYAAVARHVGSKWSLSSAVVWAGEKEKAWAEEIVEGSDGHAVLTPATSLQELTSLLRRAWLFVGSDTGPLHLAVAVGTSCGSVHGTTPAWQSGPCGEGHIPLQEMNH
nr:glycosyltransferase family 9 protein [Planctomycetota bacterium]